MPLHLYLDGDTDGGSANKGDRATLTVHIAEQDGDVADGIPPKGDVAILSAQITFMQTAKADFAIPSPVFFENN